MTKTLHINITNKVATYQKRDGVVVCGNSDYQVAFTFDSEWDTQAEKTARFVWNGRHRDVKFSGNTCPVPIVTKASELKVGVYAGELETTTAAVIPCVWSILCQDSSPTELDEKFTSAAEEAANQAKASEEAAAASAAAAKADAEIARQFAGNTENIEARISRNDKRITNLERGTVPDPFETDDSVAYTKDVPANALPYAEISKVGGMTYKDGDTLKSAKVTEIESVERNLSTAKSVYANADRFMETTLDGRNVVRFCASSSKKNRVVKFAENTQYTMSGWFKNVVTSSSNAGDNAAMTFWYTDGTSTSKQISRGADWTYLTLTSAAEKTVEAVGTTSWNYTTDVYVDVDTFMLNKGSSALPYASYTKHTLPIPEAVQALEGYGLGVSATYHNYVDWENKRFVQRVGKFVLTGSEPLEFSHNRFKLWGFAKAGVHPPVICVSNKYVYEPTVTSDGATKTGVLVDGDILYIRDMAYNSLASFKAYLAEQYANGTPVTIVYALAEPIETDITDLLTADNFIEVEGGGTITAVNTDGLDAPSEITYMIKEVTA